jgi:phage terminase large subunit
VPYDPVLRVHTVWDLGWADSMSIIFCQRVASEMRCIDYIEDSYKRLDEYVEMLNARGYNYGTDYIPHDGASRDIKTGRSTEEVLRAMKRRVVVIPRGDVEEGIKAARLAFPRTYFDKTKTAVLVNHLKRYRRHIPQSTNTPGSPVHDEHSHGADAFRELALVADQMTNHDEPASNASLFEPRGIGIG